MGRIGFWRYLLIICMMNVFVSVCSASASLPAANSDPKATVAKAYQQFLTLKNYHMSIETAASLSFQGKNANIFSKAECDVQVKPMVLRNVMDITIDTVLDTVSKRKEQKVVQYTEEAEKQLIVYSKINGQWVRQTLPYNNLLNENANFLKDIISVAPINEDDDSAVFEVEESASNLKGNLDRILASTGMQKMKITDDLLKNLSNLKYTITIDKKTSTVSKIDMDMSEFVAIIGNNLAESGKVPDNEKETVRELFKNMKIVTSIAFSRLNKVEKIVIPPEAKNIPNA